MDCSAIYSAVELYLQANGYGGLCRPDRNDSCGCGIDDLMPCGDRYAVWDCEPAYALPCVPHNDDCAACYGQSGGGICYSPYSSAERAERRKRMDGDGSQMDSV